MATSFSENSDIAVAQAKVDRGLERLGDAFSVLGAKVGNSRKVADQRGHQAVQAAVLMGTAWVTWKIILHFRRKNRPKFVAVL